MSVNVIEGSVNQNNDRIGIVAAKWNSFITDKLVQGALEMLQSKGFKGAQITVVRCPGAYEIPFAARQLLPHVDGLITIGAVIRGETPHFDYVCRAVSEGVLRLNMTGNKPVMFGVLTTDTVQQAQERSDGNSNFGNKGAEAALALIEMLSLSQKLNEL